MQELFHYTSFEAFESIIRSQVLRATHFWHTNDETEFVHVSGPMRQALAPIVERIAKGPPPDQKLLEAIQLHGSVDTFVQSEVGHIFRVAFNHMRECGPQFGMAPAFICCFCDHSDDDAYTQENGLLSMWRGYGSDGVALVFDCEKLKACLDRERAEFKYLGHGQLLEVAYSLKDDVFKQHFGDFVALLECNARKYLIDHKSDVDFHKLLLQAAAGYKHHAFVEEREVRIALFPHTQHWETNDDRKLKQATVNDYGREYIEVFSGTEATDHEGDYRTAQTSGRASRECKRSSQGVSRYPGCLFRDTIQARLTEESFECCIAGHAASRGMRDSAPSGSADARPDHACSAPGSRSAAVRSRRACASS